jgi:hypothetical protein
VPRPVFVVAADRFQELRDGLSSGNHCCPFGTARVGHDPHEPYDRRKASARQNEQPRLPPIQLLAWKVMAERAGQRKQIGTGRPDAKRVTEEGRAYCNQHDRDDSKKTELAEKLGMSKRTLSRRLAEEGMTFNEILQQLKAGLAIPI